MEGDPTLVAANHKDIGGVEVTEVDLPLMLDKGKTLVWGVLQEAGGLAAADKVAPGMSTKVGVEKLELLPEQFNQTHIASSKKLT